MTAWIEMSLRADGEAAEAIATELQRYVHQGISIEQADLEPGVHDDGAVPPAQSLILRAYFPNDAQAEDTRLQIERALSYMNMMLPMPKPAYTLVHDEDWAEAWKAHYKPVRLGQRILVRPLWIELEPQPDDIVIALDPGMAFGTGTHPTTQLCLEALERMVQPGMNALDLGCGSGILSIAAAKLGATKVTAVDIDQLAVDATLENAAQNGVAPTLDVYQGSLETVLASKQQFDLVVVNILAKIIIEMCGQNLDDTVRPGGHALFSGIITTQVDAVEAALRQTGLEPTGRQQQADWVAITAMRPR